MKIDISKFKWTREPASYSISNDKIEIVTATHRFVAKNILSL